MGVMCLSKETFQAARGGESGTQHKNLCLVRGGELKGGGT